MPITQEQYKLKPGESTPEYNIRIAGSQKTTQWRDESEEKFKARTSEEPLARQPRDVRGPEDVRADIAGIKGDTTIESEEDVRAAQATRLQKRIDAINIIAEQRIGKEEERGKVRLAQTRSMNVRGGLIGSSFAGAATERARDVTSRNVEAIQAETQASILAVQDRIDERTDKLVEVARGKAEGAIEEFQAEIDRMDKEARDDVGVIATSNVPLEDFKSSADYDTLKEQLEMSDLQLDSLFLDEQRKVGKIGLENFKFVNEKGGTRIFWVDEEGNLQSQSYEDKFEGEIRVIDGVIHEKQEDGSWKPTAGRGITISEKEEDDEEGKEIIGDVEVSQPTLNVIEGVQPLDKLTPTDKTETQTQLRQLGFYSEEVPEWYRINMEQLSNTSFAPEALTQAWNESRQSVIKPEDPKEVEDKSREEASIKSAIQSQLADKGAKKFKKNKEQIINALFGNADILSREEIETMFDEIVK